MDDYKQDMTIQRPKAFRTNNAIFTCLVPENTVTVNVDSQADGIMQHARRGGKILFECAERSKERFSMAPTLKRVSIDEEPKDLCADIDNPSPPKKKQHLFLAKEKKERLWIQTS